MRTRPKPTRVCLPALVISALFFSSCGGAYPAFTADETPRPTASPEATPEVSALDSKYATIRFGDTPGTVILDVEWYTPETYQREIIDPVIQQADESQAAYIKILEQNKTDMENGTFNSARLINGKTRDELNKYFEFPNGDGGTDDCFFLELRNFEPTIYTDGDYVQSVFPLTCLVPYKDENGDIVTKYFSPLGDNDPDPNPRIYSQREFDFVEDDIISTCDELLAKGEITREAYDYYAIKTPYDRLVKLGLFDSIGELPASEPYQKDSVSAQELNNQLIGSKKSFNMLFVGNSLSSHNDLAGQLSELAKLCGITITYNTVYENGASLSQTKDRSMNMMQNNKYDYVVFQDYPVRDTGDTVADMEVLCDEAKSIGAIPVLYNPAWRQTDGDKPDTGDAQLAQTSTYERVALVDNALHVNAAGAWIYAYGKYPGLSLYETGDYHPNAEGMYLTACTFASALFHLQIKDVVAEENIYYGDDALKLSQAAWDFVNS